MADQKKVVQIDEEKLAALMAKVEKMEAASAARTAYNARRNAERNVILAKALKQGISASEEEISAEVRRMSAGK